MNIEFNLDDEFEIELTKSGKRKFDKWSGVLRQDEVDDLLDSITYGKKPKERFIFKMKLREIFNKFGNNIEKYIKNGKFNFT